MGTVYEAYQESMRRRVALKVLDLGAGLSVAGTARFEREAWIGGRLSHPNVVKVFDQGAVGATRWIAMELVQGGSLQELIDTLRCRSTPASDSSASFEHVKRVVRWFVAVADALDYVHGQGIVHRDIKPGNLLLAREDPRLMLTDFGLARETDTAGLTRRGDFLGTVRYMSPEQLLAQRVTIDHRSDIYSLGVSLYEAVTLDLPYNAASEEAYISAVSTREPLPARAKNRSVPRDLETILIKCLEKDRERRYASAGELAADLERFLSDMPVLARRPGVLAQTARLARRNRTAITAASATLALVVAMVPLGLPSIRRNAEVKRLEAVLEQAITLQRDPVFLEPDWGRLAERLKTEVDERPGSQLALLRRRAALRWIADVPSFGLISNPPEVILDSPLASKMLSNSLQPLGQSLTVIEVSWDGGAWRKALWSVREGAGLGRNIALSDLVPVDEMSAGPHRLEARAKHLYFPADALSEENKKRLRANSMGPENCRSFPSPGEYPEPIFEETRTLGSFPVNLFQSFPPDFPRAVQWNGTKGPVESWLNIDHVRLLRVNIPTGKGRKLAYGERQVWTDSEPQLHVAGSRHRRLDTLTLSGRIAYDIPIPVAANVSLRFGPERTSLPGAAPHLLLGLDRYGYSGRTAPDGSREIELPVDWNQQESLPDPEDGTYRGALELTPSRDLALGTRRFDVYLDETLSYPVDVEVVTIEATWEE